MSAETEASSGFQLGPWRLFGIPVIVKPTFLLYLLFISYGPKTSLQKMAIHAGLLLLAVLLHELAHGLAARFHGHKPWIELEYLWGATRWKHQGALRPKGDMWITAAGPLSNVILCIAGMVVLVAAEIIDPTLAKKSLGFHALFYWTFINGILAVFNLLPILPMDGGQLMRGGLRRIWRGSPFFAPNLISILVALPIILWQLSGRNWFTVLILVNMAYGNIRPLVDGQVSAREYFALFNPSMWQMSPSSMDVAPLSVNETIAYADEAFHLNDWQGAVDMLIAKGRTLEEGAQRDKLTERLIQYFLSLGEVKQLAPTVAAHSDPQSLPTDLKMALHELGAMEQGGRSMTGRDVRGAG